MLSLPTVEAARELGITRNALEEVRSQLRSTQPPNDLSGLTYLQEDAVPTRDAPSEVGARLLGGIWMALGPAAQARGQSYSFRVFKHSCHPGGRARPPTRQVT